MQHQPLLEEKSKKNTFVIVGGGPIGLRQAFGIKKLNNQAEVVVVEKYSEYQRKHTLIMQPAVLEAVMKTTESESDPTLSNLLARLKKDPHIRTNELETIQYFSLFARSKEEVSPRSVANKKHY